MGILNWYLPKRNVLRDYEIEIIKMTEHASNARAAEILRLQAARINRVLRFTHDRDVNLHCVRRGKPAFPDDLLFTDRSDEAKLATVYIRKPSQSKKLRVDLWLCRGRLFSLEFNIPPKEFFDSVDINNLPPDDLQVKFWLDPTRPASENAVSREEQISRIEAVLPHDYLEIVDGASTIDADGWSILSPDKVRSVIVHEGDFYIIADGPHSVLMVRRYSSDRVIYFTDFNTEEIKPIGISLRSALRDWAE